MISVADAELLAALEDAIAEGVTDRRRLFFHDILTRVLDDAAEYQRSQPLLRLAYSVKTNPRREILMEARSRGLLAEVISPAEFAHAVDCGFPAADVVYNGPCPASRCPDEPGYVFADSVEALERATQSLPSSLAGLRLRPPGIDSRFGVGVEELSQAVRILRAAARYETGVSFHVRPQDYGQHSWRSLVESTLEIAQRIERDSGVPVTVYDVGGGKRPDEFDRAITNDDFTWLQQRVAQTLKNARAVLCEPGQALATAVEAIAAPVLESRSRHGAFEIVADTGYPELSQASTFAHRLYLLHAGSLRPISRGGNSRIVGRTCLEYDVIAHDAMLEGCSTDDAIVVADAGAYDSSMSFTFAEGERRSVQCR